MSRRGWKRATWIGVCLVAVAAVAYGTNYLGEFLQRKGLAEADQYASVFSLLVGIAGLVLSVVSLAATLLSLKEQRSTAAVTAPGTPESVAVPAPRVPKLDNEEQAPAHAEVLTADLKRLRYTIAVDHERLFGIEKELTELGQALSNSSGDRIISILGGPGVGKTTLAYELVLNHAREAGFSRVAAVSAKFTNLDPAGRLGASTRVMTDWRDLLVEVARQLNLAIEFNPQTVEQQLPAAMPSAPCLLVIDNLETVQESQVAVRYLTDSGLLGQHKVVLTTRAAVAGQVPYPVRERRWVGLDEDSARAYVRYLAADDPTLDPHKRDVDDVVAAAERVPLLIKIIVKQAVFNRLPIREVVTRLRARGEPLGANVWSYCYVDSLDALATKVGRTDAARLMSVFCAKNPGSSFTGDELFLLSGIRERAAYEDALAAACNLSLIRSLAGNKLFTVHSLLRQFYCSAVDAEA